MHAGIQGALDMVWEGFIKAYNFDFWNHEVTFEVEVVDRGNRVRRSLSFSGVSAFYFLNDEGDARFDLWVHEPDDLIELSSAYYCPEGVGRIHLGDAHPDWAWHKYPSRPNFAIEIWNNWLLIEAKQVQVGGSLYDA